MDLNDRPAEGATPREAARPARRWLGAYNPACRLTLAGAAAAYAALALATLDEIELALVGLMLAGLADLFDGRIARRLALDPFERAYGAQLDTVVDVCAFLATPAVIVLQATPPTGLLLASLGLFVLAGLERLAHFHALDAIGVDQSSGHRGLPVTYSALLLPLLFLPRGLLAEAAFASLLAGALGATAVAFVADFPMPKPRGVVLVALPLLAAALIAWWLRQAMG